jgi:hypothetical protein
MSAIREVKYLRELKHQNIIEVRAFLPHTLKMIHLNSLAFRSVMYSSWMSSPQKQT